MNYRFLMPDKCVYNLRAYVYVCCMYMKLIYIHRKKHSPPQHKHFAAVSQEPPPLAGMDEKAEVVLTLEEAKGLDARTVDLRGGKDTGVKGQLVKVEDRAVGRVERCGAASHGHQACTLAGQAMSTNMLL